MTLSSPGSGFVWLFVSSLHNVEVVSYIVLRARTVSDVDRLFICDSCVKCCLRKAAREKQPTYGEISVKWKGTEERVCMLYQLRLHHQKRSCRHSTCTTCQCGQNTKWNKRYMKQRASDNSLEVQKNKQHQKAQDDDYHVHRIGDCFITIELHHLLLGRFARTTGRTIRHSECIVVCEIGRGQ